MFFGIKHHHVKKNGNNKQIIVNRQKMLKRDIRFSGQYVAGFEACRSFEKYLANAFSGVDRLSPEIQGNVEGRVMSFRNVACLNNALIALQDSNSVCFWHELADFIHNYNSEEPISYNEYQVFKSLYDVGYRAFELCPPKTQTINKIALPTP